MPEYKHTVDISIHVEKVQGRDFDIEIAASNYTSAPGMFSNHKVCTDIHVHPLLIYWPVTKSNDHK